MSEDTALNQWYMRNQPLPATYHRNGWWQAVNRLGHLQAVIGPELDGSPDIHIIGVFSRSGLRLPVGCIKGGTRRTCKPFELRAYYDLTGIQIGVLTKAPIRYWSSKLFNPCLSLDPVVQPELGDWASLGPFSANQQAFSLYIPCSGRQVDNTLQWAEMLVSQLDA